MQRTIIDRQRDYQSSEEVLVSVDCISKRFCRSLKRSLWYAVKDISRDLIGKDASQKLRPKEFWAIRDLSFELRRGECLGLIGHNGAGKTTLLRMLSGLVNPDKGRIEVRGRVGGLIALGAGFNPILSGRENVYTNASLLGVSKEETDRKLAEIIDFAEIGEFIDSPVQSYSSGMGVRLGFAIAAILTKPDVLLLDEVLAVGDIGFVIKCINAVRRLSQNAAVIFVSHNMQFVSSFCTRVIVLSQGQCLIDAKEPATGISHYHSMVSFEQNVAGTGEAKIKGLSLKLSNGPLVDREPLITQGTAASVLLDLQIKSGRRGAHVRVYIHDEASNPVICFPICNNKGEDFIFKPGECQAEIPLGELELNSGKYSFVLAVLDADSSTVLTRVQGLCPFKSYAEKSYWGKIVRPTTPRFQHVLELPSEVTDPATLV